MDNSSITLADDPEVLPGAECLQSNIEFHLLQCRDMWQNGCFAEGCSEKCINKTLWESHMVSHKIKPYVCVTKKCESRFTRYTDLGRHLVAVHGVRDAKKNCYPCPKGCVYIAANEGLLKFHINTFHTGRFRCNVSECTLRFKNTRQLRRHEARDHSELAKRIYKCDECVKSYTHYYSLGRHYDVIHPGQNAQTEDDEESDYTDSEAAQEKDNEEGEHNSSQVEAEAQAVDDDEMLHGNGHEAEINESRNIRLHEDLFEKYWVEDLEKPLVDTMTELGPCKLTIGRYVFNVVMYAARDLAFRRLPPQHRPIIQYGPPPPVKKLNVEEVMAERASRDPEFMDLLKAVVEGNASTDDLEGLKDYVNTIQQATTAISEDVSAVIFEFIGGSGDRFLFPKYSILENLHKGHVTASFLIVRRGSSNESYNHELDYYEPFTIRLYTPVPEHIDLLSKVVAPPDEVQKYIGDIIDNTTKAEYVLLAMQQSRPASARHHVKRVLSGFGRRRNTQQLQTARLAHEFASSRTGPSAWRSAQNSGCR